MNYKTNSHVLSFVNSRPQKELLIQSEIAQNNDSINKKVVLMLDTGADMDVLNRKIWLHPYAFRDQPW